MSYPPRHSPRRLSRHGAPTLPRHQPTKTTLRLAVWLTSSCFDEYEYTPLPECISGGFPFPIQAYVAMADKRIKRHHVEGWKKFTSEKCDVYECKGNHLFFFDVPARAEYMEAVIKRLPTFEPVALS